MSREIKFRAFHKKRNETYIVHGWHSEFVFKDTVDGIGTDGNPDDLKDVKLFQFTGFKDHKGVEIYEGDVLSDWVETDEGRKHTNEQVFWCKKKGAWKLDFSFHQDKSCSMLLSKALKAFDYEVTGNDCKYETAGIKCETLSADHK